MLSWNLNMKVKRWNLKREIRHCNFNHNVNKHKLAHVIENFTIATLNAALIYFVKKKKIELASYWSLELSFDRLFWELASCEHYLL